MEGRDYHQKPIRQIADHYRDQGFAVVAVNQDVMKKAGSYSLGRTSINTVACFGKYIGAEGMHHTQEKYDQSHYRHSEFYPEPVELIFPDEERLGAFHKAEMEQRWRRLNALLAERRPAKKVEIS
jgi:hypothetical protein